MRNKILICNEKNVFYYLMINNSNNKKINIYV